MSKRKLNTSGGGHSITILGVLVLVAVFAATFLFLQVSRLEEQAEGYLVRVAEQQVLGQKLAKHALAAASGDATSFSPLREGQERFTTLERFLTVNQIHRCQSASKACGELLRITLHCSSEKPDLPD